VDTVVTEKPHANTAWQSFLKTGPLAFLPLADAHTCAIVWSTSPQEAERLKLLPEDAFCTELGEAFSHQLGAIEKTSMRMVIPLVKRHAESYGHTRIALCGDAAHSIHPMAGQGMNLGFQDADCLSDLIIERYQQNRDIGAESLLKQYQRRRYYHNQTMLSAMDFFDWIFSTPNPCIQTVRKMGMGVINQSSILQKFVVRAANG
jgi:2-octaprenylphenol hydroxylase